MHSAVIQVYRENNYNEGKVPFFTVIRWNPDEYDKARVSVEDRVRAVSARVNELNTVALPGTGPVPGDNEADIAVPRVEYHYYHTNGYKHIEHALEQKGAIKVKIN